MSKLILLCSFAFLLSIFTPISVFPQDNVSGLGIFDATADWGLEPEFPPQIGRFKVPGWIEVTGSEDNPIYDIFGNGDDIFLRNDEAFYVYTERPGSWRLTGKVQWMDIRDTPGFPKIALMVRNKSALANSKQYSFQLRKSGGVVRTGTYMQIMLRTAQNVPANWLEIGKVDEQEMVEQGSGIYYRITRIASQNFFYSEWSQDSMDWHFAHGQFIDMGETVSYGLTVTNCSDNESLSHGRISDVSLEPVPVGIRTFSENRYTPGDNLTVILELVNEHDTSMEKTITEILPVGWKASNISHEGRESEGIITWSLPLKPGLTRLTYIATPSLNTKDVATFTGVIGSTHSLQKTIKRAAQTSVLSYQYTDDPVPILGTIQVSADLGIFDKVSDWGSLTSPSQIGEFKIPGNVMVTGNGESSVYDILGNGCRNLFNNEGYLVYTERSGSWSLTGCPKLVSRGGDSPGARIGAQIGLMICNEGRQANSKYYMSYLREGDAESPGPFIRSEWRFREEELNPWENTVHHAKNGEIVNLDGSIFLRVTRIAPKNLFITEWSSNGDEWYFDDCRFMQMDETVAYGLFVKNNEDNDELAHGQVTSVTLQPANPVAFRMFSSGYYASGEVINVSLEVINPTDKEIGITLFETLPDGWTAHNISDGGSRQGSVIQWSFPVQPGTISLTFTAIPPLHGHEPAKFSGRIGTLPVMGQDLVDQVMEQIPGQERTIWRNWTARDGLAKSNTNHIKVSPSGHVLAIPPGDDALSFLDGYSVTRIPNPGPLASRAVEGKAGQIWSFSYPDGLQRYDDGEWTKYKIDEMPPLSLNASHSIFPYAVDRVLLALPDRVMEFNAVTRETHVIKKFEESEIGNPFFNVIASQDGAAWITGANGVAKIRRKNGIFSRESEWIPYVLSGNDFIFKDFQNPIENLQGDLFFRGSHLFYTKVLYKFDGKFVQNVYNFGSGGEGFEAEGGEGFEAENGTLWVRDGKDLKRIDQSEEVEVIRDGILSSTVTKLALEPTGTFGVATEAGIARNSHSVWDSPSRIAGMDKVVYSIHEDHLKRLWFLCDDSLLCYDTGEWRIYQLPEQITLDSSNLIPRIESTRNGLIVFNGFKGKYGLSVVTFDPNHEIFTGIERAGIEVKYVASRNNGTLLLITYDSSGTWEMNLESFDGKNFYEILPIREIIKYYGELSGFVLETRNGDLWIGPDIRISADKIKDLLRFQVNHPGHRAQCACELGNGMILAGFEDTIFEFDGEAWNEIQSELGTVYSIITDREGRIWVASGNGLHCYNRDTWISFGVEEGLPEGAIYSVFEDNQGQIWAGTSRGIILRNAEADSHPPRPIIDDDINRHQKEIILGGAARIVFSGIDKWKYTSEDRLLFSHRVDEGEWSLFTSENMATIANLPAGMHKLDIRAMDRNFNISSLSPAFEFNVILPWYREPAFLVIITVSTIIILILLTISISRHIRLRHAYADIHVAHTELQGKDAELEASNEELQAANERLLDLDKMKSVFASQASHDLRTPLTAIKSSLDNLRRGVGGGINEKQDKVLDRALRSVSRLTDLVNDILDLNRIESGRIVLERSDTSFDALVQNIIHENQPAADQKRITLCTKGFDQSCSLHIDGGKIERVVGELVSNAIKYTPENGKITVSMQQSEDAVELFVQDSGIGMTEEECNKIFDRFYRTQASQTMAKGSGLGLSIAKELVEMHDGTLSVTSRKGAGATFTMTLPKSSSQGGNHA